MQTKNWSLARVLLIALVSLLPFATTAQTPPDDDDDGIVVISVIASLLNVTVTPTITTSLQPTVAVSGQPLWFTVQITNPAILAPMKNVRFSQSLGTALAAFTGASGVSISPASCTGNLTVSATTPGNTFSLANGFIPPKTTCTYQVRLAGNSSFVLPQLTVLGDNSVAATYPPTTAGTPFTINNSLTYLTLSFSPPPYVVGSPITVTATANSTAGTLNRVFFRMGSAAPVEGFGSGLSRSFIIASPTRGFLQLQVWGEASAGPAYVSLNPNDLYVGDFSAVLDVASYFAATGGTGAQLRVTLGPSAPGFGLQARLWGLAPSESPVMDQAGATTFTKSVIVSGNGIFQVSIFNNANTEIARSNAITISGGGGSSSGGEGQNGVAPPIGNTVGATAGAFDVTDSGAATYTIPIAIPPGTAGLAPSLALSYSSQGGGAMAGVGWSLSGFSSVHRCAANQYIDQARTALTYTETDKFCLDGQRLIKLTDGTYRTERDSFSRITAVGGTVANPDYWQVESKGGLIMLYGSAEANAGVNSKFVGPNASIRAWAINKVKDRKSNYYAVDYALDSAGSVVVAQRPLTLRYTGNDATNRATFASVELQYESNTVGESALLYGAVGAQSQSLFRLAKIVTKEAGSQVRTYTLAYNTSLASKRSLLASIQECGFGTGGSLCLPATIVTTPESTVASAGFSYDPSVNTVDFGGVVDGTVYVADMNGDGKSDLFKYGGSESSPQRHKWLVKLGGAGPEQVWYSNLGNDRVVLGDFNGDGKTDLLTHISGDQWERCISTGIGFNCGSVTLVSPDSDIGNQTGADFDGDGRTDILLYRGRVGNVSRWTVCLATVTAFDCSGILDGPRMTSDLNDRQGLPHAYVGDFNGDGRADIAGYGDGQQPNANQWQVAFSNFGSGTSGFTMGPFATASRQWPTKGVVADFNGDGLGDIISGYSTTSVWEVCLSKGDGTFTCENWGDRLSTKEQGYLGDYNGDGRTDIAQWNGTNWRVCLSTGKGFDCQSWQGEGAPEDSFVNLWQLRHLTGDFNGDGKTDLAVNTSNGNGNTRTWKFLRPIGKIPDLVTQITDGLGKVASFTYEPLTTTSSYTKGSGSVFPAIDIQSPMYVATQMSTNDGVGGTRSFTYNYTGLKGHANGGGLLGFASRQVRDNTTARTTTTTYLQDYAQRLSGSPSTMQVKTDAGNLIAESSSGYQVRTVAGVAPATGATPTVFQIFPAGGSSTSHDPLLNTASQSNVYSTVSTLIALADIDDYGNVKKSTSNSGVVKVTNSTYNIPDLGAWLIGRPDTVSVTSTYGGTSLTRSSSFSYVAGTSLVAAETIEPGGGVTSLTTNHDYDASGNRTESRVTGSGIAGPAATPGCREPAGAGADNCRRMQYGYEANGRYANSTTNAAGHTSTATQNTRLGVVTQTIDPNGIVTTSTPDFLGRNIAGFSSLGINTATTYEVPGSGAPTGTAMKITSTASAAPTSVSYIDILGREIRRDTQGFDNNDYSVATSYDGRGRKYSVSRPYPKGGVTLGGTSFTYEDYLDRLVRETAPDGGITVMEPRGFTTTVHRSPIGEPTVGATTTQKTVRTVNDQGWTTSVTDALNQTTGYSHDPHGNLLQVSKPGQAAVVMTYDIRGRKLTLSDPDAGAITYAYNSPGDLVSEVVTGGRSSITNYDALGRALDRTLTAEGKPFSTLYGYDGANAKGKLVSETNNTTLGVNSRLFAYDAVSRLNTSTVTIAANPLAAKSFTTVTTYDANSRVKAIQYPPGGTSGNIVTNTLSYEYLNGYFKTAKYNAKTVWDTTDRFPDQQVKTATLGNLNVARTYDAIGRINTITTNAGSLQNATFGFDKLGNLTSRVDPPAGVSESFCYDVLNRVRGSNGSCSTFSYDGAGNLTKPGVALAYATAGTNNRLSSVDGAAITYDTGGNVKSDGTGVNARSYTYTPYDVPDKITLTQTGQWMEFGFTGNGQRAFERDGTGTTPSRITYYAGPGFFEQDNTIANGAASVSEVREYLATPAGTVGVVITTGNTSVTKYYLQDHLGSNIAAVDETGGGISRNSYDVWGVRTTTGAPWDNGDRSYTGHEHLNFGLIHMNGRVYDPRWGRFLQADPIVQSPYDLQNYNRYSYVMNNPLSFTDPTGFSRWTRFRDRVLKPIVAAVAAYYTGGLVSEWASFAALDSGVAVGSELAVGNVAGAAAGGFAAGGIMGGNLQSAVYGAVGGGFGAALGGAGVFGQMLGSGVNGYLQTGTSQGFTRGLAAGVLPNDLGFSDAFNKNAYANVGIGILRDGTRGAIVEGNRRGFLRGVAYGQTTNLIGHALGLATTLSTPTFDRGAFVYEGGFWTTRGALTLGNVISGYPGLSTNPLDRLTYEHERNHVFQQYEQALGASYIPAHFAEVGVGCLGGALGKGTSWYLFEQHSQAIPYSALGINPCGRR